MMHPDRHHLFKQPAHMVPGTNPTAIPLKHMPLLTADHNSFRVMIVRQVTVWINYWMRYTAVPCTAESYVGLLHQATSPNPVRSDARLTEPGSQSTEKKTSED